MADWIKMRSSLLTNPKVIRMARVLLAEQRFLDWLCPGCDVSVTRDETVTDRHIPVVTRVVVGGLLAAWSAVNDTAARDGVIRHASLREIDESAGVPGFGKALKAVDWLEELPDADGVRFVNFEEHNSPQKERALTAKTGAERAKEYRERKKLDAESSRPSRSPSRDAVTHESRDASRTNHVLEEKKREEKNTPHTPKGAARFDEFWSAWPKSERKQDKSKCAQKWAREGLDAVADAVLADIAAKRATRKWQEDGGKFVEAPLVYLNGRRWEDGNEGVQPARQETFV